jgi:membrane protein
MAQAAAFRDLDRSLLAGLGVFSQFYFSSTIISDSRTYGAIDAVFSILTWFIAIGAVIILGAVAGVVWEDRRTEMQPERGRPRTPRTG